MNNAFRRAAFRSAGALALGLILAGCQTLQKQAAPEPEAPPPEPIILQPLATHEFEFDPETEDVIGQLQVTRVDGEDTFSDVARRFNLGYEEMVRANPASIPGCPAKAAKSSCRPSSCCRTPHAKAW